MLGHVKVPYFFTVCTMYIVPLFKFLIIGSDGNLETPVPVRIRTLKLRSMAHGRLALE